MGLLARPRKFVRSLGAARFTFALFDMCASERERVHSLARLLRLCPSARPSVRPAPSRLFVAARVVM